MRSEPTPAIALPGLAIAAAAAALSGVAVFLNSYGVRAVASPAVYTTAKNLVAAATLVAGASVVRVFGSRRPAPMRDARTTTGNNAHSWGSVAALAYVAVIGGGVAFIAFFDGLARTNAVPASFLHDTLVVWVALFAWPLLGERLSRWNVLAVALLVVGLVETSGGVGGLGANTGNALVLGATVLWAAETIVAKRLLRTVAPATLGIVRMAGGSVVLLSYLAARGELGALGALNGAALRWVLVTGVLLGAYVFTWITALARARAVDVTSMLVCAAMLTAVLESVVAHKGLGTDALGLTLMAVGAATVVAVWPRTSRA